MLSLLAGLVLAQAKPFDFYQAGPYAGSIPRPEKVLGYTAGDKLTTFREQERVLTALAAAAPDRARLIQYGVSPEGRPLRILVVTSPENLKRIEEIRAGLGKLANGAKGAERADLVKRTPPVVWINECIHGNEPASFESAMWLAYTLCASRSEETAKLLRDAVTVINPVFNPDGHERYVVYYGSVAAGSSDEAAFETGEPGILNGRTNHYRFDMNRDHLATSQDETRQEIAEVFRWNPQVYVDQHGQVSTYFLPPNPMSINENVDRARLNRWTDVFGKETARAFDQHGWLYYVKDVFDFFAPVYTDTWAALSGAIGMTHETEGSNTLRSVRNDGSVWTMRDAIARHYTSALAVIRASASKRTELVNSYAEFKSRAVSGEFAGNFQRVVLQGDPRALARLSEQLARSGVRSSFASKPFVQPGATDYWTGKEESLTVRAGSLIVDMAQPQGALAKAWLEPKPHFEPEFVAEQLRRHAARKGPEQYPRHEGSEFYDLTGWSLPYGHNLQAWWSADKTPFAASTEMPAVPKPGDSSIGWSFPYADQDDLLAACTLLESGVRVHMTPREMRLDGSVHEAPSFLVLRTRQDRDVFPEVSKLAANGVRVVPISTGYPSEGRFGPGSEVTAALKKPGIGIVFGDRSSATGFGSIWYLMDRVFHLPFTPLSASALTGDLSKYTCIVLPSGQHTVGDKLKDWVRTGGVLVALGRPGWAIGDGRLVQLEVSKPDKDRDPEGIPGSLFRARLDPRSFLSFGYGGVSEIAVPIEGSTYYKAAKSGGAAVRLEADDKAVKLLSGWGWPESEGALAGTVWLHDQPFGAGHVILFMQDPSERAMWPGLYKLLLNAMILAPSF